MKVACMKRWDYSVRAYADTLQITSSQSRSYGCSAASRFRFSSLSASAVHSSRLPLKRHSAHLLSTASRPGWWKIRWKHGLTCVIYRVTQGMYSWHHMRSRSFHESQMSHIHRKPQNIRFLSFCRDSPPPRQCLHALDVVNPALCLTILYPSGQVRTGTYAFPPALRTKAGRWLGLRPGKLGPAVQRPRSHARHQL